MTMIWPQLWSLSSKQCKGKFTDIEVSEKYDKNYWAVEKPKLFLTKQMCLKIIINFILRSKDLMARKDRPLFFLRDSTSLESQHWLNIQKDRSSWWQHLHATYVLYPKPIAANRVKTWLNLFTHIYISIHAHLSNFFSKFINYAFFPRIFRNTVALFSI